MLNRVDQEPEALEAMSKSIADLLVVFALAGYAVLGEAIKVTQSVGIKTAATDGRSIIYNPIFWLWMTFEDRVFVLLHEFIHIFYNHPSRRGGRDPQRWNRAVDIFTNVECCVILGDGTLIPRYAISPPRWYRHGEMTVEEVYDRLEDDEGTAQEPYEDGELSEGTDMLEPPTEETTEEKSEWIERLRGDLAQARQINEQAGHEDKISDQMRSRLEKISKGTVPFDRLFRGAVQSLLGYDEVNWGRPNRKAAWSQTMGGPQSFALPSMEATQERLLLILVDVSASVNQVRLNQFASNIENAAQRATKIVIATFDQTVRERYETDRPGDILRNIKLLMGDHSYPDARPAFALAEELDPSAIACFTDGHIYLPDEPYHQTVFVRPPPPEGAALPWGREFVMEELF